MCMMVYVASDHALPTTLAWDQANPGFHVIELPADREAVRGQFSKPFVYYTGSHEGCGCGFQCDGGYEGAEEDADLLLVRRESRSRLADFLSVALQRQPEVELFACWDGDEAAEPEHRGRVRPAALLRERPSFRERELLVVSETGA
jgi:hypothetical protein